MVDNTNVRAGQCHWQALLAPESPGRSARYSHWVYFRLGGKRASLSSRIAGDIDRSIIHNLFMANNETTRFRGRGR
jgi:hypothetical protein